MAGNARKPDIPGTTLFDGAMARKGYALNKMCYSFNSAANREAFLRDEDAYCAKVRPERRADGAPCATATCSS